MLIILAFCLLFWWVLLIVIAWVMGDIKAIFQGDPAARNIFEVLTYPSLYAVSMHRINHRLWVWKLPFFPRLLSMIARALTHIEIHPGATIGKNFFIDHGDGVVIGETSVIGDHVVLYHQVTLGGTGKEKGKRHPTLGDHVVVGAGAKILGNISIGGYCKVGAGAVVLQSVSDHCTVVGNPAKAVSDKKSQLRLDNLGDMPDPIQEKFHKLEQEINQLKKQIDAYNKK